MNKKIAKINFTIIALVLSLCFGLTYCVTADLKAKYDVTNVSTRTIEVNKSLINYQNVFNDFEDAKLNQNGSVATFEGIKTFKLSDFEEIDLTSVNDIVNSELRVKYEYSYDYDTQKITLIINLLDGDNISASDTMVGVPFVNENGELDAVFDCDGEYVLLSDFQDASLIQNCGWFKNLCKKVTQAVKKVTNTVVGKVGAVATVVAPVVVGVVGAVLSAPILPVVVVGAAVGAGVAAATAIASTVEQDGKVDWETVGICTSVGAAVGAITSGLSYGVTSLVKNAIAASSKAVSTGKKTFTTGEKLASHFEKHSKEFGEMYKTVDEYLDGANYVIENGQYCQELNGYIRFFGVNGEANYAFVGMTSDGASITTFGIRSVAELSKIIPWLVA